MKKNKVIGYKLYFNSLSRVRNKLFYFDQIRYKITIMPNQIHSTYPCLGLEYFWQKRHLLIKNTKVATSNLKIIHTGEEDTRDQTIFPLKSIEIIHTIQIKQKLQNLEK